MCRAVQADDVDLGVFVPPAPQLVDLERQLSLILQVPQPVPDTVLKGQADVLVKGTRYFGLGDRRSAAFQFALVGVDVAEPKVEKVVADIVQ